MTPNCGWWLLVDHCQSNIVLLIWPSFRVLPRRVTLSKSSAYVASQYGMNNWIIPQYLQQKESPSVEMVMVHVLCSRVKVTMFTGGLYTLFQYWSWGRYGISQAVCTEHADTTRVKLSYQGILCFKAGWVYTFKIPGPRVPYISIMCIKSSCYVAVGHLSI